MTTDTLTFAGQFILTGTASFTTNGICHPLSTIQTCVQAPRPIPWSSTYKNLSFLGVNRQFDPPLKVPLIGLFRGFSAIYLVDSITFLIAYVTNDLFRDRLGPIGGIFAAATLSTPIVAIGEGAMQNRQANNLPYRDWELWRRSLRIQGMLITLKRESLWNLGIFYATPKMMNRIHQRWPNLPPLAGQMIAALFAGSIVGFMTTPIAGVKTRIQTSKEELSIFQAIQRITSPQTAITDGSFVRLINAIQKLWNGNNQSGYLRLARSTERLFAGATSRVAYISLTMCIMNLVYQRLPSYLPSGLKKPH